MVIPSAAGGFTQVHDATVGESNAPGSRWRSSASYEYAPGTVHDELHAYFVKTHFVSC